MEEKLKEIGNEKKCPIAVMMRDGKILTGYRHYTPDKWKTVSVWTIPGGRCDIGETLKDTLQREVQEEVGITDYDLLSQIKEAISKLVPKVENILNGENNIDESLGLINTISDKGMEYRARLQNILEQINSQPGHENDGFEITDIHGKVWKYPF